MPQKKNSKKKQLASIPADLRRSLRNIINYLDSEEEEHFYSSIYDLLKDKEQIEVVELAEENKLDWREVLAKLPREVRENPQVKNHIWRDIVTLRSYARHNP